MANVDRCLADGVALMDWWRRTDEVGNFADRFELIRAFDGSESGYSFFDNAAVSSGTVPVMGDVPDVFYDKPKHIQSLERWNRETEEFVLRYFMRIADSRLPQVVADETRRARLGPLGLFSFCAKGYVQQQGFGFEQLYYKLRETGEIGRFPESERSSIVDVRELRTRYEWVVASARIFDFDITIPRDPDLPSVDFPLTAVQYVILSDAFVLQEPNPASDHLGQYGFGYALLRPRHDESILSYGPGHFDAGFQQYIFSVERDGAIWVRMPFVVNRPYEVLKISLDPLVWGLRAADLLTGGVARPFLEPLRDALDRLPFRPGNVDPVLLSVDLLGLATLGQAGRQLCISREDLEKFFLIQHFDRYYQMITGSLLTWRKVGDWLDESQLPEFAGTGISS